MLGHGDTRGLLELALEDIFAQINTTHSKECSKRKEHSSKNNSTTDSTPRESEEHSLMSKSKEYSLKLSFIEIYNEKVFDLLSNSKNLVTIREDKKNFCSDATEVTIEDQKSIIAALKRGTCSCPCMFVCTVIKLLVCVSAEYVCVCVRHRGCVCVLSACDALYVYVKVHSLEGERVERGIDCV